MLKRLLIALPVLCLVLVGLGVLMFWANEAPGSSAISPTDSTSKPYVVKLHARWCAVCMLTKSRWAALQGSYGDRVNLVVFDFTNKDSTEASRAVAKRLGLGAFFDERVGEVGSVYVLDGASKKVKSSLDGVRDLAEYSRAIDEVLRSPGR